MLQSVAKPMIWLSAGGVEGDLVRAAMKLSGVKSRDRRLLKTSEMLLSDILGASKL